MRKNKYCEKCKKEGAENTLYGWLCNVCFTKNWNDLNLYKEKEK